MTVLQDFKDRLVCL